MKYSIHIVVLLVSSSITPKKPARYRLLYRSLCDAVVTYTYYTLPYAGKPSEINNETSKYYIAGTDEYTKYLVNGVNHYNSIDGSNISMDRYFTSVAVAQWTLEKKTTIVGKMRLDRKGRPKKIKSLENREKSSVLHVFDSDEKILWYCTAIRRSLTKGILLS